MIDDPLSLLSLGIWLMAAGMWPVGFLFGACSACCGEEGPCDCGDRDSEVLGEKAKCIWCGPDNAPEEITIRVTAQTETLSFERGFSAKIQYDIDCSSADGDYVLQRGTGPNCNVYGFGVGCGRGSIIVWCSTATKGEFYDATFPRTIEQNCLDNGKYEVYGIFRFHARGTLTPVPDGNNNFPILNSNFLLDPMDVEVILGTWFNTPAAIQASVGGWPFSGEFDSESCNLADLPVPASNFNISPIVFYIGPDGAQYFEEPGNVETGTTSCFGLEDYAEVELEFLDIFADAFGYEFVFVPGSGFTPVGYLSDQGCVMQIEIVDPV